MMPMSFDELEMSGHIERQTDWQMNTKNDLGNLSKVLIMFPPDTKYLYYEGCHPEDHIVAS